MIARKALLVVTSNFIVQFIGWIGLIILAKLWGSFAPEALGIIGFAMSFLALFNIIADLGFSQAHVKRISEGKDLGSCIGTYAAIKICLTGVMVTVVFIAIFIWKHVMQERFYDATTESMIFVFLIYYAFSNLSSIAIVTFAGRREVAKRSIPSIIGRMVKVPLAIIVALAGVNIVGVDILPAVAWPPFLQSFQHFIADHAVGSLAATYVIDMMLVSFVGLWFLRKYPLKKPSWELFKSYLSFALPIMLISVIGIISFNIDKIMIGYFWTSVEVGYYFTVQHVLEIITVIYLAVGIVLFPTFSKYHSHNNIEKIKETTHLAERYISMVMVPPVVLIIVLVYPIINIMLSVAFLPAVPVLATLAIYTFISSLSSPYGNLIGGMNRPDLGAKIGFVICATNIPLNYLFIPRWGLLSPLGIYGPTGAAVATIISAIVGFIGLRIAAKKLTGIKILQNHTPRHLIAGLIMGFVLYFLAFRTSFLPTIYWYHLLILAGIGLAVYLGVLFILKEFKKQDFHFFWDILHPKEMLKYISSELKEKPKKFN